MNLESAVFYRLGINPEFENIKWQSVVIFELLAKLDQALHQTQYFGELPPSGPAFLVSNHTSMWDAVKGYRIGQKNHRIIRAIVRESLVDPSLKESKEVLRRTGNKSDLLHSAPLVAKRLLASFLQGIDVNPVKRGAKGHDLFPTIRRVRQAIIKGNLVGIFIQETRHKDGSLDDLLDGPAIFAKMFPNIPIYAARITPPSHRPHIFRIDQPFTYSEVANDSSNNIESISDMTSFIGRRIASLAV